MIKRKASTLLLAGLLVAAATGTNSPAYARNTSVSGSIANSATPGFCTITVKVSAPAYANNTYTVDYTVNNQRSTTDYGGMSEDLSTSSATATFSHSFDVVKSVYAAGQGSYLHLTLRSSSYLSGWISVYTGGNHCK